MCAHLGIDRIHIYIYTHIHTHTRENVYNIDILAHSLFALYTCMHLVMHKMEAGKTTKDPQLLQGGPQAAGSAKLPWHIFSPRSNGGLHVVKATPQQPSDQAWRNLNKKKDQVSQVWPWNLPRSFRAT